MGLAPNALAGGSETLMAFTLTTFAALLMEAAHRMPEVQHRMLEKAAQSLETEAKSYPGHYQPGWAPLAESTLTKKAADTPGYETGEMRESIQHNSDQTEAFVGSNDMKLVWFELGTSRGEPPRPILGQAAVRGMPKVMAEIGREVSTIIGG